MINKCLDCGKELKDCRSIRCMSCAKKGKFHPLFGKSSPMKGRKHTLGSKKKMSLAHLGKKCLESTKQKLSEINKRENHPQWNGGRNVGSDGYILIYNANHPNKDKRNYVREHRLIMEKYIKRYLTKEEVVHHLNGNKKDNRIDNLKLFENEGLHQKYHKGVYNGN